MSLTRLRLLPVLLLVVVRGYAQNQIAITITNPSAIQVCIESDYLTVEVRNITTSTVTGLETRIDLPSYVEYVPGSLNTPGASENNLSNLNSPVFKLPDIGLAKAVYLKIKIKAACDIISFLNAGGLARSQVLVNYTGGSATGTSGPLNVRRPSLSISSISNQLASADKYSYVVRQITVKNNGSGKLASVLVNRYIQSGIRFTGSSEAYTENGANTLAWTVLDSSNFKAASGNKDAFLDINETYSFTDTVLVLLCTQLGLSYEVSWGCGGKTCAKFSASTNISINSNNPNLVFTPKANASVCLNNANKHDQKLIIYNSGKDTARNLNLDIFQSASTGYYAYVISEILTGTFKLRTGIHKASLTLNPYKTTATANTGSYCLSTNAKGEAALYLPDIAPKDSLVIEWQTQACCPSTCNFGFYSQRWKFSCTYENQCGKSSSSGELWGSTGYYQRMTLTPLNPTDISGGETQTLEYNVSNASFITPTSSALLRAELIVPVYLVHSLNASDFKFVHPNGGTWSPDYLYKSSNTVIAGFQGGPPMNLEGADLIIKITANCGSLTANYDLNYRLNVYYNPDTSCTNSCTFPVYCRSDRIRLHCQTNCNSGVHFNGFEAKRISYGDADNNNDGLPDASGNLDLSKIKTKRVMYGDTLLTVFRGRIYGSGGNNFWSYCQASSKADLGKYLDVADVRVKIYRYGTLIYDCNQLGFTQSSAGSARTFIFDISYSNLANSGCNVYTNFQYTSVDSVEVLVKYVVTGNLGNAVQDLNFTNDFWVSNNANPTATQKYRCDNFSARLNLVGYYYTNYGAGTYNLQGCNMATSTQNFYLSIGNCCTNYAGGNLFPYEYRAWAKLNKIVLRLPTGYEFVSSRLYQYRTAGTNVTDYDYLNSLSPDTIIGNRVIFDASSWYTDNGGDLTISDDGFYGIFYANYRAGCQVSDGPSTVRYDFIFEGLNYMGSGLDTVVSGSQSDIVNYTSPGISLIPQSSGVYASTDTVEWAVRLTNTSGIAWMDNLWFGAEKSSNVKLLEVEHMRTGKIYTPAKDIFKIGPLGANTQEDYIIRAVYKDCSKDSLILKLGYDCRDYPDSMAAYPCKTLDLVLRYEPLNTTLEAGILDSIKPVDLCAENEYKLYIRNTANPRVYGAYLDMLLRPGMVLNDTAWLFISGRTDSTLISNPEVLPGNTYRWDLAGYDSLLGSSGIQGVGSDWGSELLLKVRLNTTCDFVSGSYFLLKPGGKLKCGKDIFSAFAIGEPIDIKGVTRPYYSAMSLKFSPLEACSFRDSAIVKFINLGPDTTGTEDKIVISLPEAFYADTAHLPGGYNAPASYPDYLPANGENVYEWTIPSGIQAGDSMVFSLKAYFDLPAIECGYKQIYGQAVVSQPVMCVKDSSYCNIRVATSSTQVTDSLRKGIYHLKYLNGTAHADQRYEQVSIQYLMANTGTDKAVGDPVYVKLFYDTNLDGSIDSNDLLLKVDTVYDELLSGARIIRNFQFTVDAARSCDLYLYIGDSSCNCVPVIEKIGSMKLYNAGEDTALCPFETVLLGEEGHPAISYRWNYDEKMLTPDSSASVFSSGNYSAFTDSFLLILSTDKGRCLSKDSVLLLVYPGMRTIMKDSVMICSGEEVIIGLDVEFGSAPFTYQWSPPDSLGSLTGDSTLAWPITSTQYQVAVMDTNDCVVHDSISVLVSTTPVAAFELKDSCEGTEFIFLNKTNYFESEADSISWTFGKLGQSSKPNPKLIIDSAQSLMVHFYTANRGNGCTDTLSKRLNVFPNPEPAMQFYADCAYDTTTLFDLSTIVYGNMVTGWNIEGDTFFGSKLNYQTRHSGSLPVYLFALSDYGCSKEIVANLNLWEKPEIELTDEESCLNDSFVKTYRISNLNKDSIMSHSWTYNGIVLSVDSVLQYQFSDTGAHQLELLVVSNHACSDTTKGLQYIHPNPVAAFTVNDVCQGEPLRLTDASTLPSGSIKHQLWDAGKGWFEDSPEILITESGPGTYTYRHKIVSARGCADSTEEQAGVYYVPVPDMTYSGHCADDLVAISIKTNTADSLAVTRWYFDGDSTELRAFSYSFGSPGKKQVHLLLSTNRGCVSDSVFEITIDPVPAADFTWSRPCEDKLIEFAGTAFNNKWDLGDGSTGNLDSFRHLYAFAGDYMVHLEVVNGFGCDDSISKKVSTGSEVQTEVLIDDICALDSQWVDQLTTGNTIPLSYAKFNMGNGDSVISPYPFAYAYPNPGTYNVQVTVQTRPGCSYSGSKNVVVYPVPTADFMMDKNTALILDPVISVFDQSVNSDSLRYQISDGAIYTAYDFSHSFRDSGNYAITQYTYTNFGCMDSLTREVFIQYLYQLFIPNSFSPNNDHVNDKFKPVGLGLVKYEMSIYNRWGQEIWHSEDAGAGWDGEGAMMGYYAYVITAWDYEGEPHFYQGVVYLVR